MPGKLTDIYRYLAFAGTDRAAPGPMADGDIDWGGFLSEIISAGVGPLLFDAFRRDGRLGELPVEVAERLKLEYRRTLAAQIVFQKTFLEILDLFGPADISIVPLKGLYLSECAYPSPGVRPMADLDLLVPPARFEKAFDLLKSNGYSCDLDFLARRGYSLPSGVGLRKQSVEGISVDLHYSLVNTAGIRALLLSPGQAAALDADAWASVSPSPYLGRDIMTLSPPYFLLSLTLHHYTHTFAGISWFTDTIYYMRLMNESHWKIFTACLEKYSLLKLAAVYFNLAAINVGCSVEDLLPPEFLRAIRPESEESSVLQAALRAGRLKPIYSLMLLPGMGRQASAIMRFLFPSRYYLETINHRPLSRLQYLLELFKFQSKVIKR